MGFGPLRQKRERMVIMADEKPKTVASVFPCVKRILPKPGEKKDAYRKRVAGSASAAEALLQEAADLLFNLDPSVEITDAIRGSIIEAAGLATLAEEILTGRIVDGKDKKRIATPFAIRDALINATPSVTKETASRAVETRRKAEAKKATAAPIWPEKNKG